MGLFRQLIPAEQRDNSAKMSLSYGIDTSGEEDRIADFHAVRGL